MKISLIIPVFNESASINTLLHSILEQTTAPTEIILVDGGSVDDTVQKIKEIASAKNHIKIIEAGRAMPGKGRNIGTQAAQYEWVAYTDAGIQLDKNWLEELAKQTFQSPNTAIVYGNYHPQINSFLDKCSTIAYVPPLKPGVIRGKSIVSYLFKKDLWYQVGGFPDWRAAEDLVFMERVENYSNEIATAPLAIARWELQPTLPAIFKKFDLYSKFNVWAGRQSDWHYGILKQYIAIFFLLMLGLLLHWSFFLAAPIWLLARVFKRIYSHRYEFGFGALFNPLLLLGVMMVTITIDSATYTGWIKAIVSKK